MPPKKRKAVEPLDILPDSPTAFERFRHELAQPSRGRVGYPRSFLERRGRNFAPYFWRQHPNAPIRFPDELGRNAAGDTDTELYSVDSRSPPRPPRSPIRPRRSPLKERSADTEPTEIIGGRMVRPFEPRVLEPQYRRDTDPAMDGEPTFFEIPPPPPPLPPALRIREGRFVLGNPNAALPFPAMEGLGAGLFQDLYNVRKANEQLGQALSGGMMVGEDSDDSAEMEDLDGLLFEDEGDENVAPMVEYPEYGALPLDPLPEFEPTDPPVAGREMNEDDWGRFLDLVGDFGDWNSTILNRVEIILRNGYNNNPYELRDDFIHWLRSQGAEKDVMVHYIERFNAMINDLADL